MARKLKNYINGDIGMSNNIIMFFDSNITDDFNATPSLCVYDNQIINCNISMSSAVDLNSFAPYDSAELTILNRTNVHSTTNIDSQLNNAALFRVGTKVPLTNEGMQSSDDNYCPVGGIFYIENIVDTGGGIRKISGKSITALLENTSYGGIFNNVSLHNVINALYSNWHTGETKTVLCNSSACLTGLISSNTKRDVLGQILFSYGMYVDYNRESMQNIAPIIKEIRNPTVYKIKENNVYTGGCYTSLTSQREVALNYTLVALTYTITPNIDANGMVSVANVNVKINYDLAVNYNSEDDDEEEDTQKVSPIYTVNLDPPVATLNDLRLTVGVVGSLWRFNAHTYNAQLAPGSLLCVGSLHAVRDNIDLSKNYTSSDLINDRTRAACIFSNFNETTVDVNLLNIPFPWQQTDGLRAGYSNINWYMTGGWRVNVESHAYNKCYCVVLSTARAYEEEITQLFFASNGGNNGLVIESEINSINGINFITPNLANTLGNRILNFLAANATEKLSFPWNGSAPGDMLRVTDLNGKSRNGIITDMKIQLSSFPKATANIRYNFTGE